MTYILIKMQFYDWGTVMDKCEIGLVRGEAVRIENSLLGKCRKCSNYGHQV